MGVLFFYCANSPKHILTQGIQRVWPRRLGLGVPCQRRSLCPNSFTSCGRHVLAERTSQAIRSDVQPHIRSHPQSSRQIGKPVSHHKYTHRQNRHTHRSLSWPCLLTAIIALLQSTSSFHRFLRRSYFVCF